MPIKATLYEYGVSSFLQIFTSQNDYKTTKLYYSTQPVLLPVKKHPNIMPECRQIDYSVMQPLQVHPAPFEGVK